MKSNAWNFMELFLERYAKEETNYIHTDTIFVVFFFTDLMDLLTAVS
jgi:hypothetical protein